MDIFRDISDQEWGALLFEQFFQKAKMDETKLLLCLFRFEDMQVIDVHVLKKIYAALRVNIRLTDIVYSPSENELLIILPECYVGRAKEIILKTNMLLQKIKEEENADIAYITKILDVDIMSDSSAEQIIDGFLKS